MATVESIEITDSEPQNAVTDKAKKLGVKRYFTIPGRDPFDEIEWEIRDAFIPGKEKAAFDQKSASASVAPLGRAERTSQSATSWAPCQVRHFVSGVQPAPGYPVLQVGS